ncbi:MAG: hypothetical protein BWY76_00388 [bacterium ADurb.Bin429]|nr:MAG: hypothetical protein BWY76_00388 [bacterium ADurb.Bin429]
MRKYAGGEAFIDLQVLFRLICKGAVSERDEDKGHGAAGFENRRGIHGKRHARAIAPRHAQFKVADRMASQGNLMSGKGIIRQWASIARGDGEGEITYCLPDNFMQGKAEKVFGAR